MKHNKKRILGFLMAAFLCFGCSPVSAWAAETPVSISSGFDLSSDETVSTFAERRTIYGEAKHGTQITLSVNQKDACGNMQNVSTDTLTVGIMGIFSATAPLQEGYNYVTLTAEKDGYTATSHTMTIKRVPKQIKSELQNLMVLPGV